MSSAASPATAGSITPDVPCQRCRYNLRGLAVEGNCPECSTPIAFSARGDRLCGGDPAWLGTLHAGALTAFWAELFRYTIWGAQLIVPGLRRSLGVTILSWGASAAAIVGLWWLSTPDPSGRGEFAYGPPRRFFRGVLLVSLATLVIQAPRRLAPALMTDFVHELFLERLLADALMVAGSAAQFTYLARLVQRIPDAALRRRALTLRLGVTLFKAVSLIAFDAPYTVYLVTHRSSVPLRQLLVWPGALSEIGLLFVAVVDCFFLARLAGELKEAGVQASRSWSAADASRQTGSRA